MYVYNFGWPHHHQERMCCTEENRESKKNLNNNSISVPVWLESKNDTEQIVRDEREKHARIANTHEVQLSTPRNRMSAYNIAQMVDRVRGIQTKYY